jgi:hypothetical protein
VRCRSSRSLPRVRCRSSRSPGRVCDELADFVYQGVDEATARRIGRLPDGHKGLLGALIRGPRPVVLADPGADPRSCGFPERHPPMRSFLCGT